MAKVTKAVIPIAGQGRRMLPLSAAVPKALLGLVDGAGRCRAVLHWTAAQAAAAGAAELAIVMSPSQEAIVRAYLSAARGVQPAMPPGITLIVQDRPLGFGDAVLRARQFVGNDNFLLLLGDHVYTGDSQVRAAAQVVRAFEQAGRLTAALQTACAMIGVQQVGVEELSRVGVCAGEPVGARIYRCTAFIEKPSAVQAQQSLRTPGLPEDSFLAHAGIYAFTSEIFDCLAELAAKTGAKMGAMPSPLSGEGMCPPTCVAVNAAGRHATPELQLADAQSLLLSRHPHDYYLYHIDAAACDVGTPEGYATALARFASFQEE